MESGQVPFFEGDRRQVSFAQGTNQGYPYNGDRGTALGSTHLMDTLNNRDFGMSMTRK